VSSCLPLSSTRIPPPLRPSLFPYTTLFRSGPVTARPFVLRGRRLQFAATPTRWPCASASTPNVTPGTLWAGWIVVPPSCSAARRSEEHTSELQSRGHLVCRLLLEKKKQNN